MTSATFCNLPLSTAFNCNAEKSVLSLEWVLNFGVSTVRSTASGILTLPCEGGVFPLEINLPIVTSLPFDLVLGRDCLQYCRESAPDTTIYLSTEQINLRRPPIDYAPPPQPPCNPEPTLPDWADTEPSCRENTCLIASVMPTSAIVPPLLLIQ
ncbi:hypothetical protein C8R43DRAFT_1139493 [Mycena crocata]|nr:hypothetical protein C8R43DRAFT_1139493 [Mycena crocata]